MHVAHRQRSAIGFGCASLGSRIGEQAGRRAIDRAFAAGITWYDTAPSYGDGHSEEILAGFLRERRSQVQLVTKVGFAPPRPNGIFGALKPLVRSIVAGVPPLRKMISRLQPKAQRIALSGEIIRGSIVASLRRLQTDYVDALLLHEPTMANIARDDVLDALIEVRDKGYVRSIGIAGTTEVGIVAARRLHDIQVIQFENNLFHPNSLRHQSGLASLPGVLTVTHSTYGEPDAVGTLSGMLTRCRKLYTALQDLGYSSRPREAATALLLDYALHHNATGVTLVSMFSPGHLDFNLSRMGKPAPYEALVLLAEAIADLEKDRII